MTMTAKMTVRAFGIRAVRGVLAADEARGGWGELWFDGASNNRRLWQLANDAARAGVQVRTTTKRHLDKVCAGANHQGVVFVASAKKGEGEGGGGKDSKDAAAKVATLAQIIADHQGASVAAIALDGVSDPQNLGAIVRTAAAFDIGAIVMPRAASAPMNAAALRIAGGYADRVAICRVGNLRRALKTMMDAGWRTVAVDERGAESFFDSPMPPPPLCFVFGGEDKGMRPINRAACDFSARLPSAAGDAGCLNVAAAVAGCLAAARVCLRRDDGNKAADASAKTTTTAQGRRGGG